MLGVKGGEILKRGLRRIVVLVSALIGFAAGAAAAIDDQPLSVSASFEGQAVAPDTPLEFRMNRPLLPAEGRIAMFLGTTDVTNLLEIAGVNLLYRPTPLPLPIGETKISVYLISPSNQWKPVAQFLLQTKASELSPSADAGQPAPEGGAGRGFLILPALTIAGKSQPALWRPAIPVQPGRKSFTDVTLQGGLRTEFQRGALGMQSQFDVVGSSYQPEALRYGLLNQKAPNIDLANYLLQFKFGASNLQMGHHSYGSSKHLISDFTSRGMTFSTPIDKQTDLSISAMNGSTIVGWDNFFGLNRANHQMLSARLGRELIAERPGALRVEATALSGSLLPETGFNQAAITDAEKSRGGALRLRGSDAAGRLRFDAGFARSYSVNPNDPLLNPEGEKVGVRAETRNAYSVDASYQLLSDRAITPNRKANLQLNYQLERVDPWFRSVATTVQPNKFLNQAGLSGNIGDLNVMYSQQWFNDNLDDVPSLLKTLTRRRSLMLGAPLSAYFGKPKPDGTTVAWLPRLSYSYDRTHQFGAGLPPNSDFKEPQIPNQIGVNQLLTAEWESQRWRYGYRFGHSSQRNQGSNRSEARMANRTNGLMLGFAPHSAVDFNLDLNLEQTLNLENNDNKDGRRTDRNLRFSMIANWRITPRMTLTGNWTDAGSRTRGDLTLNTANHSSQFDLQWSWRFLGGAGQPEAPGAPRVKIRGQFYFRFSRRFIRQENELVNQNDRMRSRALNLGLSFTFF